MKLCTKSERNRTIRGGVIAILIFDLITKLAHVLHVDMLCHAVTLTFDLLTLNFYSTSGVIRLNSVQNLSDRIIQGWIIDDLARFRRAI